MKIIRAANSDRSKLSKSHESVSAEDLETLQTDIERRLVDIVTQKWDLEAELLALDSCSNAESISPSANASNMAPSGLSSNSVSNQTGDKSKNSQRSQQVDVSENSSDGFKSYLGSSGCPPASTGGTNSTEDSISSEGSLVSSMTSSTIIASLSDLGSQTQATNSTQPSALKRSHRSTNDRPSKRFRQSSTTPTNSSSLHTKRPPHSKHRSKIVPSKFRNSTEESRPNKKQVQRNDAPDKLWPFVEQFCATPTKEQMNELQGMIRSIENDKEYFKIPALGRKDQFNKESPIKEEPGSKNQRKNKSRSIEEDAGLGALTQRLVSSFIEESEDFNEDSAKSNSSGSNMAKKKNTKAKINKGIDMNNAKNLERRIREELEEYEILSQQDDIPYASEEDEILRDLVANQHELLSIQSQNKESMNRLLRSAKRHLQLESAREKLKEANADVIAAYYRLIQAKQRKRNPTKKEKDAAWKALKVQEAIFKECDDLYLSGLNRDG